MRLSIRAKQIAGVTLLVGLVVVSLSAVYATRLSHVVLQEHEARGRLLANAILHRAREVVRESADPYGALRQDGGLRSSLQSSLYSESVIVSAIVDTRGVVVASNDTSLVGRPMPTHPALSTLVNESLVNQLRVIYSEDGQTFEVREPLQSGGEELGAARIVISTVLVRRELNASLGRALVVAAGALLIAVIVAALLAQVLLRPIHVIRSGLTRLGQGEFGVTLDLPPGDEFGELGMFFNSVSQQLADRTRSLPEPGGAGAGSPKPGEGGGGPQGAAAQSAAAQLQSTLAYSRKLVALGRLTAGIAHEVKNPLNAIVIHLELLRTKIRSFAAQTAERREPIAASGLGLAGPYAAGDASTADGSAEAGVLQHVEVIEKEIRRLDEVVQGFLKFTRPEDLRLQPVSIAALFEEMQPVVEPEARKHRVRVALDCAASVPDVHGDAVMLRQAFLNLAINACQAMPDGGTLRLRCLPASGGRVEVRVEDTGEGIPPEHLGRIFDLYFTTKDHGTGIGLSMVFRIVQMHDGEIDVESTPGRGTTFRVLLPRAGENVT
jgi:signal transduction histidine kinase